MYSGRSTTHQGLHLGYIYSIVAAVAFAMLGITYKLSDRLKCDQAQANFFLFTSAAVIVLVWGLLSGIRQLPPEAILLGIVDGVFLWAAVVVFRKAATLGRISTSWTIINLALVMPVLASIVFWHETPSSRHYAGFALTLLAVVLLGIDAGRAGE